MTQLARVLDALEDGEWHTLADLAAAAQAPEASVSTRLRDLRLEQYGRHDITSRRRADGLFEYRLAVRTRAVTDLGREWLAATQACRRYQTAAAAVRKALDVLPADSGWEPQLAAIERSLWAKRNDLYAGAAALAEKVTDADVTSDEPE